MPARTDYDQIHLLSFGEADDFLIGTPSDHDRTHLNAAFMKTGGYAASLTGVKKPSGLTVSTE